MHENYYSPLTPTTEKLEEKKMTANDNNKRKPLGTIITIVLVMLMAIGLTMPTAAAPATPATIVEMEYQTFAPSSVAALKDSPLTTVTPGDPIVTATTRTETYNVRFNQDVRILPFLSSEQDGQLQIKRFIIDGFQIPAEGKVIKAGETIKNFRISSRVAKTDEVVGAYSIDQLVVKGYISVVEYKSKDGNTVVCLVLDNLRLGNPAVTVADGARTLKAGTFVTLTSTVAKSPTISTGGYTDAGRSSRRSSGGSSSSGNGPSLGQSGTNPTNPGTALSTDTTIQSITLLGVAPDNSDVFTLPIGTNLSALTAADVNLTLTDSAATVGSIVFNATGDEFEVEVIAEDTTVTQVYTYQVTVATAPPPTLSSDTSLSSVTVDSQAVNLTTFTLQMVNGYNFAGLTPADINIVLNDTQATVSTPALSSTNRQIDFTVTAEDGSTQSYTVTLTEAAAPPPILSTDATLTAGTVQGNTLTLSGTSFSYQFPVGTNLTTLVASDFTFTANDATASIGTPTTADSGATWTLLVTAEDGTTTETYTVNLTVAAPVLSSDATLTAGTVQGNTLVLSGNSFSYQFAAGFNLNTLTAGDFSFTANDATATIGTPTTSDSGATWDIVVTAEDGSLENYTVNLTVAAPILSSDSTLSSVTITQGWVVTDNFDGTYDLAAPYGFNLSTIMATDFTVTATDTTAMVNLPATVDGGLTWTVLVTAEDLSSTTYTLNIVCDVAPTATISMTGLSTPLTEGVPRVMTISTQLPTNGQQVGGFLVEGISTLDDPNLKVEYLNGTNPATDPWIDITGLGSFGGSGFVLQDATTYFRLTALPGSGGSNINVAYKLVSAADNSIAVADEVSVTIPVLTPTVTLGLSGLTGNLTEGVAAEYEIETTVPVDQDPVMVFGEFSLTGAPAQVEYLETNGPNAGQWFVITGTTFGPPITGFPLTDGAISTFRVTPLSGSSGGTINYTFKMVAADGSGDIGSAVSGSITVL